MVKIKIGKREFEARPTTGLIPFLPEQDQLKDDRSRRLRHMLEGRNPQTRMVWTCPEGPWKPGPKGAFKNVEPRMHFFGYPLIEAPLLIPQPPGTPPRLPVPSPLPTYRDATDDEVRAASMRLLRKTIQACGFAGFEDFSKELFARFGGAQTHEFDLDRVLSGDEKSKFSWQVNATLRFRHFTLFDWPVIDNEGQLLLSVPDRIEFACLRIEECTPQGRQKVILSLPEERQTLIRAATPDVFRLRKDDLDREIAKHKAAIEEARKKMAELPEKRNAIQPEGE